MNAAVKLGGFVVAAVVVLFAAYGLGQEVGPVETGAGAAGAHGDAHIGTATTSGPDSDGAAAELPGGLLVADDGYRLQLGSDAVVAGQPAEVRFQVLGPDERPLTAFTPTHDRPLHLIAVRRDLTGFQHVHPALGADGTWRIPMTFGTAGDYRLFADFAPAGRAEPLTLGTDLAVAGEYIPAAPSTPARTATVDDYTVQLDGELRPGRSNRLTLTVSKAGVPVTDLQPYLGAYGHLVALRAGDLAYLHVHPDGEPGDGRTPPGPAATFAVEVPSAGSYRLFLDFQHQDVVRTATFTVTATDPATAGGGARTDAAEPDPAPHAGGH